MYRLVPSGSPGSVTSSPTWTTVAKRVMFTDVLSRLEIAKMTGTQAKLRSEEFRVDFLKVSPGGRVLGHGEWRGMIIVTLNVPEGDVGVFLHQLGPADEFTVAANYSLAKTKYVMHIGPMPEKKYGVNTCWGYTKAIPAKDVKKALCPEGCLNIEARITIQRVIQSLGSTRHPVEKSQYDLAQTIDAKEIHG